MRSDRLWVISFAFAVSCGSSDDAPSTGVPGGVGKTSGGVAGIATSAGNASGGTVATGGVAGPQPSGGTGGFASGGRGANPSGTGGNSAGASMSGGTGGAFGSGGRGTGIGGRGSGGRGAGAPSTGGTIANGGRGSGGTPATGGAGGCVENLACKPEPPPSTGDLHQDCVDRINQFRTQCACLPPLARRMDGEACADQMAEYDAGKNSAHAGARDEICQPGGAQNECPGYSSNNQVISLCLQQMWDEGPPPTDPCDDACFQEYGHFINMTDTRNTRVACGFFTTSSGKVWSVQNFSR